MIQINFEQPKVITIIEPIITTVTSCNIEQVIDISIEKRVNVIIVFEGGSKNLTLWEGDVYDTIGQWTDTDVINRIKELI